MNYDVVILIIIFLVSCQAKEQKEQNDYSDLSLKIDRIVSENKFNGVILISIDSTCIYTKAMGFSDLENKIKIDVNDQFFIGSISKQITAVLVLREYEKGKIGLDDTIDQYLTAVDQPWTKEVTIHQLLTHTHGIVSLDKPLKFTSGSEFQYSQLGYELLAQILEKSTKRTFEKLSTEFFETHGLESTFHPNNEKYRHLVKGYEENEKGTLVLATNNLDNYVAAGGFVSNANDLIKWNQKLYSCQLVEKETLNLMTSKYATRTHPVFEAVNYGYGVLFKDGERNIQIGTLGYVPGFVSTSYFHPHTKTNLVILENIARGLDDYQETFKVHTEIMELLKVSAAQKWREPQ